MICDRQGGRMQEYIYVHKDLTDILCFKYPIQILIWKTLFFLKSKTYWEDLILDIQYLESGFVRYDTYNVLVLKSLFINEMKMICLGLTSKKSREIDEIRMLIYTILEAE
jgi:hypothetical protein